MEKVRGSSPGRSSPVAREGWVFIGLFGLFALVFLFLGVLFIGIPLLLLMVFTIFFFRNPERVHPQGDGLILSPADGTVVEVSDLDDNVYTNLPAKKISVFMSVFNVHVNRVPLSGSVKDVRYHAGRFLVASLKKASVHNERNVILLDTGKDRLVAVVQIAGLIARRIVCYLSKGDPATRGDRLGLIRFGSRVELYLPKDSEIDVVRGDKVRAGVTVIGRSR